MKTFYDTYMRRFQKNLFSALIFCAAPLFSEEKTYTYWDFHPLHAGASTIFIGKADVKDTPYHGDLIFNKINTFLYMLVPINEKNYFIPRVEWNTFQMDWNKNPKFTSTDFNYVQFALTFFSNAIDKWRWILRADYNMDTHKFTDSKYSLFSGLLWGSYEIWKDWHYHVGVYGYTGLESSQVYPVIGFDYTLNKKWLFLLIFPIDYLIQYKFDENWSLALKGRPLKERFRTKGNQPQPNSVFNYSTMGAEINLRYEIFLRLEAEIFGGCNFGGSFYIKDKKGHNSLYTYLGNAPYGGANVNWGF